MSAGTHKPAEAVHKIEEPKQEALSLLQEYRKTMPSDVLHLWASDACDTLFLQHERIAELEKYESNLIAQRDHCEEVIDRMADAVLGKDRPEWSSAYDFMDAAQEVDDRIAELESQLDAIGAGGVEPLRKQAAQAVHQIAEPAAPVGKPIKDAIDALVMAAFTEGGCYEHRMSEARIQTELRKKELCTLIAATQPAAQDAQKPVFVLGSAPNAVIPSDIDTYFVIAANGAIAAFPSLVPDVLILNGYTLVDASGVGPETRARLQGRRVKKLIVIDNLQKSDKSTASRVLELGIQYERIEFWSKVQRAETCINASDIQYAGLSGNDIPSTGVTAICYAISLSKDVTISGIGIESDGHSYSSGNYKRGHIEVDSQTLKAIAGKFKVFGAIGIQPAAQGMDVVQAAKALCKHAAKVQNINFDDYWLIHAEEFKEEAQIVLDAAQAKQGGAV